MNAHMYCIALIGSIILGGCERTPAPLPVADTVLPPPPVETVFRDRAHELGIDFNHFLGATGALFFPEIAGSGVALFDYDGDGDLDLYVLQGAMLEAGKTPADSILPPADPERLPVNRLYRNELIEQGSLSFTDVTDVSGLGDAGYGMGVAVGDTDNDGDPDVFVSNFGSNRFFENNGDGTFALLDDAFPAHPERWTTSASFTDIDNDGDLDLFAANYVAFTVANNIACSGSKGQREYCGPIIYPPTTDNLWRNDGDNRFVDISADAGIAAAAGNGLGTSASDLDGDGDIDIYVANDMMENRLWLQDTHGRFADTALMAGAAYNATGSAEASMGVTTGDFDADGDEDLFMTHLNAETNTLYMNDGAGNFADITDSANLGVSSLRRTGFGTAFFDYDNDGWLDLFIANGAVLEMTGAGVDPQFPFGQANQLYRNERGRFVDVSHAAGATNALKETSRGAAFGDIDNDGDIDIALSNGHGPLRLLINEVGNRQPWLRVKLVGTNSNRDAAGARVAVRRTDGSTLWRRAHTDGSYLSASDIRVHFGLGDRAAIDFVGVVWPSGQRERWRGIEPGQEIRLVEGSGSPWPDGAGQLP